MVIGQSLSKGNIYYRWHRPEAKNGQTIVMVHGFSTPSFVWNGLLSGLLKKRLFHLSL